MEVFWKLFWLVVLGALLYVTGKALLVSMRLLTPASLAGGAVNFALSMGIRETFAASIGTAVPFIAIAFLLEAFGFVMVARSVL
jgi:hypothetical protein